MNKLHQRKGEELNTQMQYKAFSLNGKKEYYIGLNKKSGKIKVYKHIDGDQKPIIVKKLAEIIKRNVNNNFPDRVKKYVSDYQKDLDKSDSKNTRRLGKILFDYLNRYEE